MPPNIINPRKLITLREDPVSKRIRLTPIKDRGKVNRIRRGCHKDSNSAAITIKTSVIARSKANLKEENDSFMLSASPLISTLWSKGISTLSIIALIFFITLLKGVLYILEVRSNVLSPSFLLISRGPKPLFIFATSIRGTVIFLS